jgi:hypothetical protein
MLYDLGDQGGQYGQAGAQALLAEPLPYLISFQAYSDDLNIRKVVDMPAVSGKQCGGARPGAGRPPGHLDRKTIEKNLRAEHGVSSALASGVMPLDIILSRMRRHPLPDGTLPTDDQYFAATPAADVERRRHHRHGEEARPPVIEASVPSASEEAKSSDSI